MIDRVPLRFLWATIAASAMLLSWTPNAHAQTTVQLIFGGTGSFGMPTAADYIAGTLESVTPLPFQVVTTAEPSGSLSASVYIRSASPTLGGSKPVADLEWRRGDDPTWRALTTSDALVEIRQLQGAPEGHTWDNTIHFRVALRWANDPPATYTGSFVITVSASR